MSIKKTAKKIISCALAAFLLAGSAVTVLPQVTDNSTIQVQAATSFEYREWNTGSGIGYIVKLNGSASSPASVTYPSSYNGKPVVMVDQFPKGTPRKNIVKVTVPDSVKYITRSAFEDFCDLQEIRLPNNVHYGYPRTDNINEGAFFYGCSKLKKVNIPTGWKALPGQTFAGCSSLTSITLPQNIKEIGMDAMQGCTSLKNLDLGKVQKIDMGAFSGCTSLEKLTIPSTASYIDFNVIYGCNNLKSIVVLSKNVTYRSGAFKVNDSLHPETKATIYGYKGSTTEAFAKENRLNFVPLPSSISLSKSSVSLYPACSATLTAKVSPSGSNSVTWESADKNVATVSGGKITAKKAGTATITAKTVNGIKATCKVTVTNYININKDSISLGKGETFKLKANKTVNWRTSNSKIVTADKNGNIKAVGQGKAWVTAKASNGAERACTVTVKKAPTWVLLSKGVLTIKAGQKASLSANVAKDAACATRTFRTSNSSVVKMTKTNWTGEFVGVKPGVAYVTVRTYNGKERACKVTVTK